jgi:hypothetical protein
MHHVEVVKDHPALIVQGEDPGALLATNGRGRRVEGAFHDLAMTEIGTAGWADGHQATALTWMILLQSRQFIRTMLSTMFSGSIRADPHVQRSGFFDKTMLSIFVLSLFPGNNCLARRKINVQL